MKKKGLSAAKAKQILKDGYVKGKPLTEKQKKFFGSIASGATPLKKINGGWLDKYNDGGSVQPNYNDSNVSLPPGFKGWGYDNSPSGYNPAWNGPVAQDGYTVPLRKGVRLNYDEQGNVIGESTHLMKAEQLEDGTWVGFPSLFQNSDGKWIDMSGEKDWMNIYNEALNRGEVIEFGTDKEAAIKFGEGSWKTPKKQMGGSLPGASGMMYGRTSGTTPEEPTQAKNGGRCWPGYKTVAGKTPFSKGSCQKAQNGKAIDWSKERKKYPGFMDNFTGESEYDPEFVDFDSVRRAVRNVESLDGKLMWNPESTATGLYGQRFSEIKNDYPGTRKDFVKDTVAQNEFFKRRFYDGLEASETTPLLQDANDLYNDYSPQIKNFPYSKEDIAVLSNFIGRGGTRKYLGYAIRDGKPLAEALPNIYGPNAKQSNKTPEEYLEKARKYYQNGGDVPKAQDGTVTLSQYEEPAWYEKAADYLASPMTALNYIVQGKDLPDRLPINVENRNPYDMAVDMINPFAWGAYAESADRNMSEGNYIDATFDALSAIPVIPAWLSKGKNVTKAGKNAIKKTAKSKSEIDWGKWNKKIPENKALMEEYKTIEQQAKANGTWMKNPDGSTFKGTPEQFVQQNSENFKKAYPEGFDETYRGDNRHYNELRPKDHPFYGQPIFTGNEELAAGYASKRMGDYYNPNIKTAEQKLREGVKAGTNLEEFQKIKPGLAHNLMMTSEGGTHHLAIPKTNNQIVIDAQGRGWTELHDRILYNEMSPKIQQRNFVDEFSTDDLAEHIYEKGIDRARIFNVVDGDHGNVLIHNQKPGSYAKSLRGNNGMFDMTNPNIYKAIFPGAVGLGAASQIGPVQEDGQFKNGGWLDKFQEGGVIEDNRGQWAYPGKITKINSNNITMQGVPYPVLGISDTGDMQLMQPEGEYKFKGNNVTEFPMAQKGKTITVNSKNHPRYKAYQDSLKLSNTEKKMYESESGLSYDDLLSTPPFFYNRSEQQFSTSPSYGYTESGKPLYGYKPKEEVIVKKSRPKQQSVTTLKSKDIVQPEMSVEDFDIHVPVVDYWNVTKEVNQNFGGRKSTFKVKDEAELERLKRQQEIDEQTTTGKNNKLIIIPNYDSGRMKKVNISAKNGSLIESNQLTNFTNYNTPQPGGWLDKYN